MFENTQEAIIDQETFDNVQRIRSNVRRYPDGWGEAHPLTGLMYCADCGSKMYVHRVNNGKRVPQYTCSAYVMTSVGNNDRGTLIVPDSVIASLEKDVNALLVQYEPNADSNEILQKMIPIGLDSTHGYRYAEKNMMYETFYGLDALVSFLCCYIGLVFLLICAALLALKQLTETTDNVYRYGLLQKLGAGRWQIDHTLFVQTAVFFAIPLVVAGVYSAFLIGKAMAVVEEFMNIHIATNIGLTIVLFLLVYGSYFLATYLSCKRIVTEQRELEV